MPTVAEFFDELRGAIKRGAALDADLPRAFISALRFIEQNYNLSYMRKVETASVTAGATTLEILDEATRSLKSLYKLGYQAVDGTWYYLRQVDPGEFKDNSGTAPAGYILTRLADRWVLTFDRSWPEARTLTLWRYDFTVWVSDTSISSLWLVNNASQALLARCMIYLAPVMRDPQLMQMYNQLWLEAATVMIQADGELAQGNR